MESDISTLDRLKVFSQQVVSQLPSQAVLALQGELGSGKTTFTQNLLTHMGVSEPIKSPTFTIMNRYQTSDTEYIYHLDLYRLKDQKELMEIGLEELFESARLVVIEWPEIASSLLPSQTWWLQFQLESNNQRTVFLKKTL